MFCPNCKGLLRPTPEGPVCPRCGTKGKGVTVEGRVREKVLVVVEERKDPRSVETGVVCPDCGNASAFFHQMQTRRSDEPPTLFYECTACHKKWRKY